MFVHVHVETWLEMMMKMPVIVNIVIAVPGTVIKSNIRGILGICSQHFYVWQIPVDTQQHKWSHPFN